MNHPDKFEFNTGYQWDIIKYILLDKKGYRALLLCHYNYFDLLDQQIIVRAITSYFDKRTKVPNRSSLLLEEVKAFYRNKDYVNQLKDKDRKRINRRIKSLYRGGIIDSDDILESIGVFASYVDVKDIMSKFDITRYQDYEKVFAKLSKAITKQNELDPNKGAFLVKGTRSRLARREFSDSVIPTPFHQLNRTTNAGGLVPGAIAVIMDKEKGGKTLSLINVARGYLRKRKKVCFLDFENGIESVEDRLDQSLANVKKKELKSKTVKQKIQKILRKYERLGAELYYERLPAGSTFDDVELVFSKLREEEGFIPEILIADYFILMAPTKERSRDDLNISQVYIDAKNFANKHDLDCVWTANHVKFDAYKRRATRYRSGDAAKALDIGRNADLILGVNQNEEEELGNILRWEVVDQRDGGKGTVLFVLDHSRQRLEEFTNESIESYYKNVKSLPEEDTTDALDEA